MFTLIDWLAWLEIRFDWSYPRRPSSAYWQSSKHYTLLYIGGAQMLVYVYLCCN